MELEEPEGWRPLWLRAQQERDTRRLEELVGQLNQLLDKHHKKTKTNAEGARAFPPRNRLRISPSPTAAASLESSE